MYPSEYLQPEEYNYDAMFVFESLRTPSKHEEYFEGTIVTLNIGCVFHCVHACILIHSATHSSDHEHGPSSPFPYS